MTGAPSPVMIGHRCLPGGSNNPWRTATPITGKLQLPLITDPAGHPARHHCEAWPHIARHWPAPVPSRLVDISKADALAAQTTSHWSEETGVARHRPP